MGIIYSNLRIVDTPGERDKGGLAEEVQALIVFMICNFFFPKERPKVNVEIWNISKILIGVGCLSYYYYNFLYVTFIEMHQNILEF